MKLFSIVVAQANKFFFFRARCRCLFSARLDSYFKNARMIELDEFLGDIHNDIVDLEQGVLRQV